MTFDEIRLRRLDAQHLLAAADTRTAVKDLCGVQAQFLNHALHGLHIRCGNVNTERLVKSWTVRGTMHLFSEDDLPLFLHEDRKRTLRPVDTLESDSRIGARRKAYFAELILDAVSRGTDEREALKILCEKAGMTETESRSLFDPWGGIIRALCESGRLCHKVQEKKAYRLCPEFEPMTAADAEAELLRRYFTHFGPAGIKDAAYFFGTTQTGIRNHLGQLPVSETPRTERLFIISVKSLVLLDFPRASSLPPLISSCSDTRKAKAFFFRKNICVKFSPCRGLSARRSSLTEEFADGGRKKVESCR